MPLRPPSRHIYRGQLAFLPSGNGHYWRQRRKGGYKEGEEGERREADGAPVGQEGCREGTGAKTRGCLR